jgi:hypothetical protein
VSLHFGDAPTVSVTILLLGQLSALPSSAPQSRGVAMGAYTVFLDVAALAVRRSAWSPAASASTRRS